MKTQRTWPYLSLVALMSLAGCSTSRQTAQTTGEMDDLYASSANAVVLEGSGQSAQPAERTTTTRDFSRQRTLRNTNPDYAANDDQRGYDPNQDEYYTELTTRKLKRGLSPDPGWTGGSYNDGFTDGYYAGVGNPSFNGLRWNPWGFGSGFNNGFSLGLGVGSAWGSPWGMNSWNRWGGGFYDPFWGGGFNSYAYSPWGWGGGFNNWGNQWGYDPYWGGGFNRWGGGGFNNWGGGWNRPVIVNNNTIITGADPYRNSRSYGARGTSSTNRYNDNFNNTARSTDTRNTGGRTAYGNGSPAYGGNSGSGSTPSSSDGYYARPRQNSRGGYYYENGGSPTNGNSSRSSAPASTYSNPGNSNSGGYYSAPRQNSRGSYTPPSDNSGSYSNGNSSRSYSQPSYQAPTQQRSYESRSESRPSYQPSQSNSQPSYSAPSSGGSSNSSGGGGYSGGGGGGSRGPR